MDCQNRRRRFRRLGCVFAQTFAIQNASENVHSDKIRNEAIEVKSLDNKNPEANITHRPDDFIDKRENRNLKKMLSCDAESESGCYQQTRAAKVLFKRSISKCNLTVSF